MKLFLTGVFNSATIISTVCMFVAPTEFNLWSTIILLIAQLAYRS